MSEVMTDQLCVEDAPLLLAEQVPCAYLEEYYATRRRKRPYVAASWGAQCALESALAADEVTLSDEWYDAAEVGLVSMTDKVDYADPAVDNLYPEAAMLRAQLPVFNARRSPVQDVKRDDIDEAHQRIVTLLVSRVHRRRPGLKLPLSRSRRCEFELAALCSRLGKAAWFPYAATAREERHHDLSAMNHDLYLIQDDQKIPIQVKSTLPEATDRYDPRVLVIAHSELAEVAGGIDVCHNGISELLADEEQGRLREGRLHALNRLTGYVIRRVEEHREINCQ